MIIGEYELNEQQIHSRVLNSSMNEKSAQTCCIAVAVEDAGAGEGKEGKGAGAGDYYHVYLIE